MKTLKLLSTLLLMAIVAVGTTSCSNDNEDPIVGVPSITAPTDATVLVGQEVAMDFTINVPGKVAAVTVAATDGTATVVTPSPLVGETTGTVTVTYTAPLVEGSYTISLTVTDAQTTANSTTTDATVVVTLTPISSTELLVAKFTAAPTMDGTIDEMWATAQQLVSTAEVPNLDPRLTFLNSDGAGVEEGLGLFDPYSGEKENFTMRSGYNGDNIYFLIEWDDADDSKDRQSWYFDGTWKQEHKYANDASDKFYEDKFAFLFPIGTVDGFSSSTCYATCHSVSTIENDKDKHTRHYLKTDGQLVDMWHWKRVRGTYADQVDDQQMTYVAPPYTSGSNGRSGDATGSGGYADNKQILNNGTADVSVPLYVIPAETNYYWIDADQIANGTAKMITAVDANGVLTYSGGTIDPADGGFAQGTGNMRIPSVTTKEFTEGRGDISVKAVHTGAGWVCEVQRKLNTGDADDVVFDPTAELPFGFAIFNNAAIAHAIKPGLTMKFEQ